MCDINLTGVG